ncbi:tumor necrosis factor ligand superfamily member 9 [Ambystoma mexicanum]|uniref:tumor necrosis factor ligand superfamily member 9 n=1 Tax=Ambystoma mexicanum TaxID=8296 RepID=UPI0037E7F0E5
MTMESPTPVRDPESQEPASRGVRKMDICMLVAIALLTSGLAAFAAFFLFSDRHPPCHAHAHHHGGALGSAHLVAEKGVLKNGVVSWLTDDHSGGLIQHPDYEYQSDTNRLQVNKEGVYYVYTQLSVRCVSQCDKGGKVTLSIHRDNADYDEYTVLTVTLLLPAFSDSPNFTEQSKFSATMIELSEKDHLFAKIEFIGETEQWQLADMKDNFLGIFPTSRMIRPTD